MGSKSLTTGRSMITLLLQEKLLPVGRALEDTRPSPTSVELKAGKDNHDCYLSPTKYSSNVDVPSIIVFQRDATTDACVDEVHVCDSCKIRRH